MKKSELKELLEATKKNAELFEKVCGMREISLFDANNTIADMKKDLYEAKQQVENLKNDIAQLHKDRLLEKLKYGQLLEAAEFDSLVAKRLAKRMGSPFYCNSECYWYKFQGEGCKHEYNKSFCRLREARIEVEQELELNMD